VHILHKHSNCGLGIIAAAAHFLCCACPSPSLPDTFPAPCNHIWSISNSSDSITTIGSLAGSHLSVFPVILGFPSATPKAAVSAPPFLLRSPTDTPTTLDSMESPPFPTVVLSRLACLVLPTRSAMMRFPFLVCRSLPPPQAFRSCCPADSNNEVPIPRFSHHPC
jgi:hypothetical protein